MDRLIATFLHDRAAFRPVTVDELRAALREGRVILLDVRLLQEDLGLT